MGEAPTPAGMYDYYLGGRANTMADREAAERIRVCLPDLKDAAWANRGFLQRSVRWLAQQGVHQFADLGAGLPTQNPTHVVARAVNPDARVVYVDNDPRVTEHALPLLAGLSGVSAITADLREPAALLTRLGDLLDLTEPVGLLMVAVLHFVSDQADPQTLVRHYTRGLATGSYLAVSHITADHQPPDTVQRIRQVYEGTSERIFFRTHAEVTRLFTGLHMLRPHPHAHPVLAHVGSWGAEDLQTADSDGSRWSWCALAHVPSQRGEQ